MSRQLPMSSKVRLNDQVDIPSGACQIMYVDRPGVIRKVAPIIPEDAKLHEDHRDYHPFVEASIFIHFYN